MNYETNSRLAAIHAVPGKAMGIWALVMAFIIPVVGLVLGIIALLQSRRADVTNTFAAAGVAIGGVLTVAAVVTTIAIWTPGG